MLVVLTNCMYFPGVCQCNAGFTGTTCDLSVDKVPVVRDLPQNGSCDIQTRPCQETPVQGDYFIKSDSLTCKIQSYQVLPLLHILLLKKNPFMI